MVNVASQGDYEVFLDQLSEFQAQGLESRRQMSSTDWLATLAPGTRGAVARLLVEGWANSLGLEAYPITDHHQRYVVISGQRVQVKLSTLWRSGDYHFQQIRDQSFDYLLCLGISPRDIHAWLIPKDELFVHLQGRAGQHTGAGAHETYWLRVSPGRPEPWLSEFGDQLSDVRGQLLRL